MLLNCIDSRSLWFQNDKMSNIVCKTLYSCAFQFSSYLFSSAGRNTDKYFNPNLIFSWIIFIATSLVGGDMETQWGVVLGLNHIREKQCFWCAPKSVWSTWCIDRIIAWFSWIPPWRGELPPTAPGSGFAWSAFTQHHRFYPSTVIHTAICVGLILTYTHTNTWIHLMHT